MSDTLKRLDRMPDWITKICSAIDRLEFADFPEYFAADCELDFGLVHVEGLESIVAFFAKLDAPMRTRHEAREFWEGGDLKMVRGEATLSRRGEPDRVVTPPFAWFLTMAREDPQRVRKWAIVAGPVVAELL